MGLYSNAENYIILTPEHGRNAGKQYVFKESSKRWSLVKNYTNHRPKTWKDHPYFCASGLTVEGKWTYGNYSCNPTTELLPVPELIYDIKHDKVYVFEGQLWELNTYHLLDVTNDPELNQEI